MSDNSQIEVECRFAPSLAGGAPGLFGSELHPLRIDCFGTHELNSGELCHRERIERAPPLGETRFIFSLDCAPSANSRAARTLPYASLGAYSQEDRGRDDNSLAASTAIVFNLYCTTANKLTAQECGTTAGTAIVPLAQLCAAKPGTWLRFGVYQNQDAGDSRALRKGTVLVRCVPSEAVGALLHRLRAPTEYDIDSGDDVARARHAELCRIIDRGMQPFFDPRRTVPSLAHPTHPVLLPFHTPVYVTPRASLPSSAYATHMPAWRAEPLYYERLLDVALARTWAGRVDSRAALALADSRAPISLAAFASLCVRVCTTFPLSLCYLDDFANTDCTGSYTRQHDTASGNEDFKIARLCGADDCEGVALDTRMHVRELCSFLRTPDARQPLSPLLRRVAEFLAEYEPVLMLACVTNAKMTSRKLDQRQALAHTLCALLHRKHTFYAGELAPGCPPVLFAESTAPIDPAMRPIGAYGYSEADAARALENVRERRSITDLTTSALQSSGATYAAVEVAPPAILEAGGEEDYSTFYKHAVGFTSVHDAAAPKRQCDFALLERGASYGVSANSMLDGDMERVQIRPILQYSEHEARLCDAVMADLQPIPPLRHPGDQFDHGAACAHGSRRVEFDRKIADALRGAEQSQMAPPSPDAPLHGRTTFITARERDVDERLVAALVHLRQSEPQLRFRWRWYTLAEPLDGSNVYNCVLDVYLYF